MRSLVLLAFPFLVLACGGHVDSTHASNDPNDNSNNDDDGDNEHPARDEPHNSYDLTFTGVTATPTFDTELLNVAPASNGKSAVLYIGDPNSSGPMILTPRWGAPASFVGELGASSMSLSSGTAVFSDDTSFYVTDTWTDIQMDRSSEGDFAGTFTATGTEEITEGDEVFEATLVGSGTIAHDATPPDVRLGTLPSYGLLPWDPIPVQFAEPMSATPSSILSLSPASANGVVSFDPSSLQGTVLASNWSVGSANVVSAPFRDLASLSFDGKSFAVSFFDAGAARPAFSLDSGDVPNKWDDSGLISFLTTDPSCESGGCAKIGPLGDHGCTIPNSGLAGVLQHDLSHASTLFVRYRILVGIDDTSGGGTTSITPDSSVFSVETATPGQAPSSQSFGFASTDLQTIDSTFGMTQATPWTTASISLPVANELGFGIRFGSNYYCGGPIFNENSTIVLIDSITSN